MSNYYQFYDFTIDGDVEGLEYTCDIWNSDEHPEIILLDYLFYNTGYEDSEDFIHKEFKKKEDLINFMVTKFGLNKDTLKQKIDANIPDDNHLSVEEAFKELTEDDDVKNNSNNVSVVDFIKNNWKDHDNTYVSFHEDNQPKESWGFICKDKNGDYNIGRFEPATTYKYNGTGDKIIPIPYDGCGDLDTLLSDFIEYGEEYNFPNLEILPGKLNTFGHKEDGPRVTTDDDGNVTDMWFEDLEEKEPSNEQSVKDYVISVWDGPKNDLSVVVNKLDEDTYEVNFIKFYDADELYYDDLVYEDDVEDEEGHSWKELRPSMSSIIEDFTGTINDNLLLATNEEDAKDNDDEYYYDEDFAVDADEDDLSYYAHNDPGDRWTPPDYSVEGEGGVIATAILKLHKVK